MNLKSKVVWIVIALWKKWVIKGNWWNMRCQLNINAERIPELLIPQELDGWYQYYLHDIFSIILNDFKFKNLYLINTITFVYESEGNYYLCNNFIFLHLFRERAKSFMPSNIYLINQPNRDEMIDRIVIETLSLMSIHPKLRTHHHHSIIKRLLSAEDCIRLFQSQRMSIQQYCSLTNQSISTHNRSRGL